MAPLIADTSALYALVDRTDPNRSRAAAFLKAYGAEGGLVVSNHVFDETMTVVKARLGVHVAVQVGLRLRHSRFVEMVLFSQAEELATWRVFSHYVDQDCGATPIAPVWCWRASAVFMKLLRSIVTWHRWG
jgi:predicted nucleic acid-binding protein